MDQVFVSLGIGYQHPLTHEYVLSYQEVLTVLQHITTNENMLILGGDVLNKDDQYIYENWFYSYSDSLSRKENMIRSCDETMKFISSLSDPHKYHYVVVLGQ